MNTANSTSGRDPAAFETNDIPHALAEIARPHEAVKSESDLISNRLTWLAISESFLFSAFATAVANYRDDLRLVRLLDYLMWVTPLVGMFLAASVYVAILAAHTAIGILKCQRDGMIARLPIQLRIDLISNQSRLQKWGNLPTHVIAPTLFLVWAGAFALWFF